MWVDAFCVNGIFLRNDGELADFGLISTCKEGRAVRYLLSGFRGFFIISDSKSDFIARPLCTTLDTGRRCPDSFLEGNGFCYR